MFAKKIVWSNYLIASAMIGLCILLYNLTWNIWKPITIIASLLTLYIVAKASMNILNATKLASSKKGFQYKNYVQQRGTKREGCAAQTDDSSETPPL